MEKEARTMTYWYPTRSNKTWSIASAVAMHSWFKGDLLYPLYGQYSQHCTAHALNIQQHTIRLRSVHPKSMPADSSGYREAIYAALTCMVLRSNAMWYCIVMQCDTSVYYMTHDTCRSTYSCWPPPPSFSSCRAGRRVHSTQLQGCALDGPELHKAK